MDCLVFWMGHTVEATITETAIGTSPEKQPLSGLGNPGFQGEKWETKQFWPKKSMKTTGANHFNHFCACVFEPKPSSPSDGRSCGLLRTEMACKELGGTWVPFTCADEAGRRLFGIGKNLSNFFVSSNRPPCFFGSWLFLLLSKNSCEQPTSGFWLKSRSWGSCLGTLGYPMKWPEVSLPIAEDRQLGYRGLSGQFFFLKSYTTYRYDVSSCAFCWMMAEKKKNALRLAWLAL